MSSSPLSMARTFGSSRWAHHERIAPWAIFCSSVKSSMAMGYHGAISHAKECRRARRGKGKRVEFPRDVTDLCARLAERGKRSWIVGGCVRDLLFGREVSDWDLATDARPDELMKIFPRAIPTGIEHGTVTVVIGKKHYEVTTLRGEAAYSDGRRPDAVHFVDDITADLARRDFTFNAIAIDPTTKVIIDPFDGRRDLEARVLRAVGNPIERFSEDGLRVLRAARFVATLEVTLDPATERA